MKIITKVIVITLIPLMLFSCSSDVTVIDQSVEQKLSEEYISADTGFNLDDFNDLYKDVSDFNKQEPQSKFVFTALLTSFLVTVGAGILSGIKDKLVEDIMPWVKQYFTSVSTDITDYDRTMRRFEGINNKIAALSELLKDNNKKDYYQKTRSAMWDVYNYSHNAFMQISQCPTELPTEDFLKNIITSNSVASELLNNTYKALALYIGEGYVGINSDNFFTVMDSVIEADSAIAWKDQAYETREAMRVMDARVFVESLFVLDVYFEVVVKNPSLLNDVKSLLEKYIETAKQYDVVRDDEYAYCCISDIAVKLKKNQDLQLFGLDKLLYNTWHSYTQHDDADELKANNYHVTNSLESDSGRSNVYHFKPFNANSDWHYFTRTELEAINDYYSKKVKTLDNPKWWQKIPILYAFADAGVYDEADYAPLINTYEVFKDDSSGGKRKLIMPYEGGNLYFDSHWLFKGYDSLYFDIFIADNSYSKTEDFHEGGKTSNSGNCIFSGDDPDRKNHRLNISTIDSTHCITFMYLWSGHTDKFIIPKIQFERYAR